MAHRIRRTTAAAGLAVFAAALLVSAPVGAGQPYRAPRTAYGQPDLQGVWSDMSLTRLERRPGLPLTFATRAEERAY
ncbi:MAG TPA: hypothetical protein VGN89_00245, partial [Phenylobacterium sp.]|nr:hypothetical protein [Phenylobacterium sp.]